MKRALPILGLVVVAGIAGWAGLKFGERYNPMGWPPEQEAPRGLEVAREGDLAPPITLPDLHGEPRALSDWLGRPVLVNFWASWCGPCIEEMPLLDGFAQEQGAEGVQVIGIALDNQADVEAFLADLPVRYTILMDQPGPADSSVQLGNSRGVLPYSVLLDAEGRVLREKLGVFTRRELADWARLVE